MEGTHMVTKEDLVDVFEEDAVLTLHGAKPAELGIPPEEAETLGSVGLPVHVENIFTISVSGEPTAFTRTPVEVEGETFDILILGGPPENEHIRYFLDLERRYIVMLVLDPAGTQAEVINGSLMAFIEFLYRYTLREREVAELSGEESRSYTEQLVAELKQLDPVAFREPDAFWSLVFSGLM